MERWMHGLLSTSSPTWFWRIGSSCRFQLQHIVLNRLKTKHSVKYQWIYLRRPGFTHFFPFIDTACVIDTSFHWHCLNNFKPSDSAILIRLLLTWKCKKRTGVRSYSAWKFCHCIQVWFLECTWVQLHLCLFLASNNFTRISYEMLNHHFSENSNEKNNKAIWKEECATSVGKSQWQ